jgi:transporter family protein
MQPGIIFAIIAAIAFGIWTVFHQQAADKINYLFGAILVSLTAVILGLIFLLPKIKTVKLYSNPKGILFAVLAGVCALAIDYFALKAYGSGLAVSVSGPIIIGGSIAIAAIIGFFLGESITFMKILGLLLVIGGS